MKTSLMSVVLWVTLGIIFVSESEAKEPVYDGRPLSDWIFCVSSDDKQTAFMAIGTNALPVFLEVLEANDNGMKHLAARLESKSIKDVAKSGDDTLLVNLRESVILGFELLGTNAEPAIPRLKKILEKGDDETGVYAAVALGCIGNKGFVVLTNFLNSKNPSIRASVAMGFTKSKGSDVRLAIRLIEPLLKDPDTDVRSTACQALAGCDPEMVVPLLIPMISDPEESVKRSAALSLGEYGTKAKPALGALVNSYTNHFDGMVFNAIKSIDLESATNAEWAVLNSGPLNHFRSAYTRTRLKNGLDLIAGGGIYETELVSVTNHCLSSAEIYDNKTGQSRPTGSMTTARESHAAVLLPDGRVFVVGGNNFKVGDLTSAEIYDPNTETWKAVASMHRHHNGCDAVVDRDGTVLVFYKPLSGPAEPLERYDVTRDEWTVIKAVNQYGR